MVPETPRLEYSAEIEDADRPRGILSKRDRQFLVEESYREELTPQSRRNVRSRLRERVRNAILDFYLLDEYLDERDRDSVFSGIDSGMREGLHSTMAFLYRGADSNTETFESWIEGGLTHIELEGRSRLLVDPPTVAMDITPGESVDPDAVEAKIDQGNLDDLTSAELRFLLWRAGKLFGNTDSDTPSIAGLGQYVDRFEQQTQIAEVQDLLEKMD